MRPKQESTAQEDASAQSLVQNESETSPIPSLTDTCINQIISGAAKEVAPPPASSLPKGPATFIDSAPVPEFLLQQQIVIRFVRDALQLANDNQKENADRRGRKNKLIFRCGDRVLLSTTGIAASAVTNVLETLIDRHTIGYAATSDRLRRAAKTLLPATILRNLLDSTFVVRDLSRSTLLMTYAATPLPLLRLSE